MESNYLKDRRERMLGIKPPPPPKEQKPIAKVSAKKQKQIQESKEADQELEAWYDQQISKLTGKCQECGERINTKDRRFAKMSIAHVLPKRNNQFPSVATHPVNFIELCVTNGCHPRYDKSWEDAAKMKIWPIAVEKFKVMYPSIAANERKHIPEVLRQEVL